MLPTDEEPAASEGSGIHGNSTSVSRNNSANAVNSGSRSDLANLSPGRTPSDDGHSQKARPRVEDPPAMASLLSCHCLVDDAAAVDGVQDGDGATDVIEGIDTLPPGSPFPHRRNRLRGPPVASVMTPDAASCRAAGRQPSSNIDLLEAQEDLPMLPPRQQLLRPVSSSSIALRSTPSNSSADEREDEKLDATQARQHAGGGNAVSSPPPGHVSSNVLLASCAAYDADGRDGKADKDGVESAADSLYSSPAGVTLWGVGHDLRRKRIKKVSHYILGPLLGEGSYGVVRDCIDLSTDNADRRFSRCAIKIINGSYTKFDALAAKPNGTSSASPAAIEDATGIRVLAGTLKRTSGMQYRREEDLKRQEMFQREMRNLQRFHSKNIIRALDAFTRYSKEYVVMPIAICSLRQLVQQMLRTRWREAVRGWWRAQRRLQRKQRRHRDPFAPSVSDDQTQTSPQQSSRLPLVPSEVEELDIDAFTFMADDECDGDEDTDGISASQPHSCSDGESDVATEQDTKVRAVHHEKKSQRIPWDSSSATEVIAHSRSGQCRPLPRVSLNRSSSAAIPTHLSDSYTSHPHGSPPSRSPQQRSSEHWPAFAGGHRHGGDDGSWGDDVSDDSCVSTTGINNGITVISATPPALSVADLPGEYNDLVGSGINDAEVRLPTPVSTGPVVSEHHLRPRMPLPVCSPTLLKGIFYQIVSGVAYLHQQHLAHNDIKPSNVLLFEDGTVKLADLGSVSDMYNDQGSPLCASPELCKYFYGAATPPASFSQSTQHVGRDAAQSSDMWCCGLMLYYLITGKPGPLPVQLQYFRALNSKQAHQQFRPLALHGGDGSGGSEAAQPPVVTRYQLYREIAQQTAPVDLSDLPDMVAPDVSTDVLFPSSPTLSKGETPRGDTVGDAATYAYAPNGVRHLLAGLLELDPLRRLTAEEALRHPWLRMAFRSKMCETSRNNTIKQTGALSSSGTQQDAAQQQQRRKVPSKQAMEEAIQRDVARRVMESRHVQHMLRLDRQRHLQFVADCCNILNLAIPPEIIKVRAEAPYRVDNRVVVCSSSLTTPQAYRPNSLAAAAAALARSGAHLGPPATGASTPDPRGDADGSEWAVTSRSSHNAAVTGVVLRDGLRPRVMPPGCVDTQLFLPPSEEDYYEQKSGKAEFDVRELRRKPLLMAQLDEYLHNVVLVQCGYRTGPDPNYQVKRVRVVPTEEESRDDGSGERKGGTQQPAVMILPGTSGSLYRRGPSQGLSSMPSAAAVAGNSSDDGDTDGASSRGELVEVWAAGPRHNPRTHADIHREEVSAPSSAAAVAGRGADLSRANLIASRLHTSTSLPGTGRGGGNGSTRRRVPGRGHRHGQRDVSDSPSEEEANVAMRESSKCLCGLV